MAYTSGFTAVTGAVFTAAQYNTNVRDNFTAIWVGTTAGDDDYYTSSSAKTRRAIGTAGQVSMVSGGVKTWQTGERFIPMYLNNDVALATGDYQGWFVIPVALNGWNITSVIAMRSSGTGVPSLQVRRIRSGVSADVLSTQCTIDTGEVTSATAATPAVINAANDDLATGDILVTDVDAAGTTSLKVVMVVGVTKS